MVNDWEDIKRNLLEKLKSWSAAPGLTLDETMGVIECLQALAIAKKIAAEADRAEAAFAWKEYNAK